MSKSLKKSASNSKKVGSMSSKFKPSTYTHSLSMTPSHWLEFLVPSLNPTLLPANFADYMLNSDAMSAPLPYVTRAVYSISPSHSSVDTVCDTNFAINLNQTSPNLNINQVSYITPAGDIIFDSSSWKFYEITSAEEVTYYGTSNGSTTVAPTANHTDPICGMEISVTLSGINEQHSSGTLYLHYSGCNSGVSGQTYNLSSGTAQSSVASNPYFCCADAVDGIAGLVWFTNVVGQNLNNVDPYIPASMGSVSNGIPELIIIGVGIPTTAVIKVELHLKQLRRIITSNPLWGITTGLATGGMSGSMATYAPNYKPITYYPSELISLFSYLMRNWVQFPIYLPPDRMGFLGAVRSFVDCFLYQSKYYDTCFLSSKAYDCKFRKYSNNRKTRKNTLYELQQIHSVLNNFGPTFEEELTLKDQKLTEFVKAMEARDIAAGNWLKANTHEWNNGRHADNLDNSYIDFSKGIESISDFVVNTAERTITSADWALYELQRHQESFGYFSEGAFRLVNLIRDLTSESSKYSSYVYGGHSGRQGIMNNNNAGFELLNEF